MKKRSVLTPVTIQMTFIDKDGDIADPDDIFIYARYPTYDPGTGITTYSTATYQYPSTIDRVDTGIYQKLLEPSELQIGLWEYDWQGTGAVALYDSTGAFLTIPRRVVP